MCCLWLNINLLLEQNQSLLASSLQTAYNLRVLPELVQSLIRDLSQAVEERIRSAFDLSKISRDASAKGASFYCHMYESPLNSSCVLVG